VRLSSGVLLLGGEDLDLWRAECRVFDAVPNPFTVAGLRGNLFTPWNRYADTEEATNPRRRGAKEARLSRGQDVVEVVDDGAFAAHCETELHVFAEKEVPKEHGLTSYVEGASGVGGH
jgi:hypothetical protein